VNLDDPPLGPRGVVPVAPAPRRGQRVGV